MAGSFGRYCRWENRAWRNQVLIRAKKQTREGPSRSIRTLMQCEGGLFVFNSNFLPMNQGPPGPHPHSAKDLTTPTRS